MIEKYLISPGFLAVTLVAGLGTAIAQDDIGDAARGKEFYYTHGCYGCHGYNGETGARDLVGTNSPLVANVAFVSEVAAGLCAGRAVHTHAELSAERPKRRGRARHFRLH